MKEHIESLRKDIDRLDAALVYILAERFACTEEIGRLKDAAKLPALDADREENQRRRLMNIADEAGIDFGVVDAVFTTITERVRQRHDEIRRESGTN